MHVNKSKDDISNSVISPIIGFEVFVTMLERNQIVVQSYLEVSK